VIAEACRISPLCQDIPADYDVILDRISHDVPFYRTYLEQAAASGLQGVNNPFRWGRAATGSDGRARGQRGRGQRGRGDILECH